MQSDLAKSFVSSAISDRGLSEKRPQNEDSYLELEAHGLFAVADGVGGAQAGDVASQMAVEILEEAFVHQGVNVDAEDTMKAALERANSAIFQMATDLPQLSSMATTVVALRLDGNIATIGHVGDSRLYSIDPSGKLHRETADHSVVEEEVRAGRMTEEQALNHPSRNIISRALGAEQDVEVETKTVMVQPGTTFLLCSDGITRHIPDVELQEMFALDSAPEEVTKQLKAVCFERGAEDNLTAIVVRVSGSRTAPSVALPGEDTVALPGEDTVALPDEDYEDTVASARPIYAGTGEDEAAAAPSPDNERNEELGETFADIIDLDDETDSVSAAPIDASPIRGDAREYASSSVVVPASIEPSSAAPPSFEQYSKPAEPSTTGAFSKAASSIFFLLLGGVLGAAAFYMAASPVLQPQPQPLPPALVEKSPDVPLTSFEESRRLVDADPTAFLNANAASPQDAEDYFLLGRASLLTGKFWEAKRAFIEARNRLAQADPKNAKTLAAEIAIAIAVIESPGASEAFTRNIAASNTTPTASDAVNSNSPVNSAPTR